MNSIEWLREGEKREEEGKGGKEREEERDIRGLMQYPKKQEFCEGRLGGR